MNLSLPPSLESIGDGAFMNCSGLTDIEIAAGVKHIGSGVFQACENLTSMTVDCKNTTFDARERCNAIIETATDALPQSSRHRLPHWVMEPSWSV